MVQSDNDLVIEVSVLWIHQQERDVDHNHGVKEWKQISTPTNYLRNGNTLWVISWCDRNWWKNLRGGAKAQVLLAGQTMEGRGQVIEEQKGVAQSLFEYYSKVPQVAKYVQIGLDATGKPIIADCEDAAQKLVIVKIDLL